MQEIKYIQGSCEVRFPYRIYDPEPKETDMEKLDKYRKLNLFCMYTRSNNGYIREKYVRKILESDFEEWCIPYIVKLCDEYVIEILECIYEVLKDRDNSDIREFCRQNNEAVRKSYSRMVSYWNEYYRKDYPDINKYVGVRLFKECFR